MKIVKYDRSIIPACDVPTLEDLRKVIEATHDVELIGGYKVGFELVIPYSLTKVVEIVREFTDLPIIYDHQKAGTDISGFGNKYANTVKKAGADAIILFPQSGPATEEAWIKGAQEAGLGILVGGEMTHPQYKRSEGGYIVDEALDEMYLNAAKLGVTNFVVPGNKPDRITHYKSKLESFELKPTFFAPGFVAQGGKITEAAQAAGDFWHAIVGRGITQASDIHAAAKEMTSKLR